MAILLRQRILSIATGFVLFAALVLGGGQPSVSLASAIQSTGAVSITPDQMVLTGDVVTRANCIAADVCSWVNSSPAGSIILGVYPASSTPEAWDGGSASLTFPLNGYTNPTVMVLNISWLDANGKGLHSPLKNSTAVITWDGASVWGMRTLTVGENGDYYAAQHTPIQTTLVISGDKTHTLTISVPPQTAWDISQITLTPYAYPAQLRGIGYSPYRDCQTPGGTTLPTQAQILEDLTRLSHTANAVRTYASTGINASIPALANSLGLRVYAGAWLNPGSDDNAEINGLIQLAKNSHMDGAIVGNEYYLRNRTPAYLTYLAQKIDYVKSQIPAGIPVMTAEVDDVMFRWQNGQVSINPDYKPILDRVDWVMVHIYPFWSGKPVTGAAQYTVDHYNKIKALIQQTYPGKNKRVVIGETGWPSAGSANGEAVPSLANQRLFMLQFMALAEKEGVEYFYFDAFDELWKIEESGHVGQNWGYSYADRTAKHPEYGVLLPGGLLPVQSAAADVQTVNPETALKAGSTPVWTVYDEWPEDPNSFVPSGWVGDLDHINIYACDRSDPYSGEMAIRASFTPGGAKGWGGVYWQYPENNWGNLEKGINLSQANKLTFWAKGEKGGEKINFFVGGIGTQNDAYPDSLRPPVNTGFLQLSDHWQQYTINLYGQNLSHVIGGFGWVTDQCANPQGAVFYLDQIQFETDPSLLPPPGHGDTFPIYTDAGAKDNHFVPGGFMDAAANPQNIEFSECWADNPHSGQTSIRVKYTNNPAPGQYGGGVYWLDQAENWGNRPGGIDLTGVKHLIFWARSDTPWTQIKILIGGVGYDTSGGVSHCNLPTGQYPDSVCPGITKTFTLTSEWERYFIDLTLYPRDYRHTIGGFGFYLQGSATFYLDDIYYTFDGPANPRHGMPIDVAVDPQNGLAYVVNQGSGDVWALNGQGETRLIKLPASDCPEATAYGACLNMVSVSPFNHKAYIGQWMVDKLNILDSLDVIGWVYGGQGPAGIVPSPYADTLYALDKWGETVTVIKGDNDLLRIPASEPNAGCVSPLDKNAYIANSGAANVLVIHDTTLAATIDVGLMPIAAACAADGKVYIVNGGASPASVSIISGQKVTSTVNIGQGTTSLGVDGYWGIKLDGSTNIIAVNDQNGDVFVSNWRDDTVSVINNSIKIADIKVGHHPNAIGFYAPTQTLYVANTGDDTVSVIRNRQVIATLPVGIYPIALAINPATGDVFVANRDSNSVTILRDVAVVHTSWMMDYFLPILVAGKIEP